MEQAPSPSPIIPEDHPVCSASRGLLFRLGLVCSVAGILWSAIYTVLDFPFHYLPLLYAAFSLLGLILLRDEKRLAWAAQYQLLLILLFPAIVQAGLGGFASGGLVILWSALAPLCALSICTRHSAGYWLAAFAIILGVSAFLEPSLAPFHPPPLVSTLHLLANIVGFLVVVFFLLAYAQAARLKHLRALEEYNRKLKDMDRLKSEFLSMAAHELRTPLTAIKGFLRLLSAGEKLTTDQIEYIGVASTNADRLYQLVNDLLDLSKLEAGLMPVEKTLQDPLIALRHALQSIQPLADTKKIALVEETPAAMAPLKADHAKLEQIAVNLLGNALKFTPEGGRITMTATLRDRDLSLTVRDTGPGMPPEVLQRVFEKFYQAPGSSHVAKGTGLGLTISQKLVELHGGRIWAESIVGQGSAFHVEIPYPETKDS